MWSSSPGCILNKLRLPPTGDNGQYGWSVSRLSGSSDSWLCVLKTHPSSGPEVEVCNQEEVQDILHTGAPSRMPCALPHMCLEPPLSSSSIPQFHLQACWWRLYSPVCARSLNAPLPVFKPFAYDRGMNSKIGNISIITLEAPRASSASRCCFPCLFRIK